MKQHPRLVVSLVLDDRFVDIGGLDAATVRLAMAKSSRICSRRVAVSSWSRRRISPLTGATLSRGIGGLPSDPLLAPRDRLAISNGGRRERDLSDAGLRVNNGMFMLMRRPEFSDWRGAVIWFDVKEGEASILRPHKRSYVVVAAPNGRVLPGGESTMPVSQTSSHIVEHPRRAKIVRRRIIGEITEMNGRSLPFTAEFGHQQDLAKPNHSKERRAPLRKQRKVIDEPTQRLIDLIERADHDHQSAE